MIQRVLLFLVLLLSVECLCMATAVIQPLNEVSSTCQGDGVSCPSGASAVVSRKPNGSVETGRPGATDSQCTTGGTASKDCVDCSQTGQCTTNARDAQGSCPSGDSSCQPTPQEPAPTPREGPELNAVQTDHSPQGKPGENGDRGVGPLPPPSAPAPPTAPKGNVNPTGTNNVEGEVVDAPAEQVPPEKQGEGDSNGGAAGSADLPASEPEHGSGEQRTTGESAGKAEGEEEEPSHSSDNSNQE
ncbi:uncharacterized protein TM35_000691040, partial [Trypanosoma theileri]